MAFSEDFMWGVATASYQIEGAPYKAGGGYTVWDMFCKRPGAVCDADNGDVACDHYNRFREDAALMQELGIPNYRLSISWPRVMPAGVGAVSEDGIGFYDKLVDELLARGIQPHVTLFHWDAPYELYLKGGWLNRDHTDWFADYVQVVVDRLSDRVKSWMTLNEPQCFIGLGHQYGVHAPGDKLNMREVLLAGHHALLAHGKAVQVIRARTKQPAEIGWAPVGNCFLPATDSPEDIEIARKATYAVRNKDVWNLTWWADPVLKGCYPEDGLALFGADAPVAKAGDFEIMNQPLDFFGANIYHASTVKAGENGEIVPVAFPSGMGRTLPRWPVTPSALYWGPKFIHERYNLPIIITENGLGLSDWVAQDGKVHDAQRIDFCSRYIKEFKRASDDGVPAKGYFQWSFMDNFEWQEGYQVRFGMVHCDYQTQVRTPKDSAYWYKGVIESNGATL